MLQNCYKLLQIRNKHRQARYLARRGNQGAEVPRQPQPTPRYTRVGASWKLDASWIYTRGSELEAGPRARGASWNHLCAKTSWIRWQAPNDIEGFFNTSVEYLRIKLFKEGSLMDSKKNIFWGSYEVYTSNGTIISKGEIYSHDGRFPERAIARITARHTKNAMIRLHEGRRMERG